MASINGLGGVSSIYGNRNVLSGLASGMDTESMIENAVSGIKLKITGLQQKRTKTEWQQQALRSIIDKMANFTDKYTSYASSTNLLSASFFNNAVKASVGGKNAEFVSAVGKTSSDIQILGVKSLASAATYRVSGSAVTGADGTIKLGGVDWSESSTTSNLTGSLTFANGENGSVTIDITEEDLKVSDGQGGTKHVDTMGELAEVINKKLEKIEENGNIKATVSADGKSIEFSGTNAHHIKSASGKIKDTLGIDPSDKSTTLSDPVEGKDWTTTVTKADRLSEQEINITVNGVTKRVKLAKVENGADGGVLVNGKQTATAEEATAALYQDLADKVNAAFGDKVTLKKDAQGQWAFSSTPGTSFGITGSVGKDLGMTSNSETSYVNTGKKLSEILKGSWGTAGRIEAKGAVDESKPVDSEKGIFLDEDGNRVKKDGDTYYRVDDEGAFVHERVLKINDAEIKVNDDTTLESLMTAINSNVDAGVNVSYSKLTNEFKFTAKQTGSEGQIKFEGLAAELFAPAGAAGKHTDGTDAEIAIKVNGNETMTIKQGDNTFDLDGMKVTVKDEFGYEAALGDDGKPTGEWKLSDTAEKDAATFSFSTDTDKIIGAVKEMVKDYNEMVTEIRKTFSTIPGQMSNGKRYEPLTDKDRADMSESEIKAYEEKAKQGLLFADRDLSGLYSGLTSAINMSGLSVTGLSESLGLEIAFSDGVTTLKLDEEKLRATLEADPDKVRDIFTASKANGSDRDGLMQSLKNTLDEYGKTTGKKGILVERAGSVRSPATLHTNEMQRILDNFDKQIDRWTAKMTDQVDVYTRKFSQLEQLVAQMNSQSASLAGLMGG